MAMTQQVEQAGNGEYLKQLKSLSRGSCDANILRTIELLKSKKGVAEVVRRAGRGHVPIVDKYYRTAQLREFLGAVILRRDPREEDLVVFEPQIERYTANHARMTHESFDTVAGDLTFREMDPQSVSLDPRNQLYAIDRESIVLRNSPASVLEECKKLRDEIQDACKTLFFHARKARIWRYVPQLLSQSMTHERERLAQHMQDVQEIYRSADHQFGLMQTIVYGIELGKKGRNPEPEDIRYIFDDLRQHVQLNRVLINGITWFKAK